MTNPLLLPVPDQPCPTCGKLHDPVLISCRSFADRQRRRPHPFRARVTGQPRSVPICEVCGQRQAMPFHRKAQP